MRSVSDAYVGKLQAVLYWLIVVLMADPGAAQSSQGSLFLVGGGRLSDRIVSRFVELAGRQNAKLVVIPTGVGCHPTLIIISEDQH